jgi:hypothetical protein
VTSRYRPDASGENSHVKAWVQLDLGRWELDPRHVIHASVEHLTELAVVEGSTAREV